MRTLPRPESDQPGSLTGALRPLCRVVGMAADAPGEAKPDSNAAVVKMEPVIVSGDSLLSFGFSIRVVRTESPRQLVGMYVDRVQKGSDAEKKGLRVGMQIVAVDHRAAASFDPTFASGSDLAKIFVGRHDGDSVVLDVLETGKTKAERLTVVRRTMINLPKIGGVPFE
jgi:PDZ domain